MGLDIGRGAWAVDDGGGGDDGDDDDDSDDDDDDLVSGLATGLPGNQETGNMYYRFSKIQCILILFTHLRYEENNPSYERHWLSQPTFADNTIVSKN